MRFKGFNTSNGKDERWLEAYKREEQSQGSFLRLLCPRTPTDTNASLMHEFRLHIMPIGIKP